MQTPLPADAGPIWQIEPGNRLDWFLQHRNHFICSAIGLGQSVQGKSFLCNWRVAIALISLFALTTAAWQTAWKKNDFWVGKIIFWWNWTSAGFVLFCVYCCLAGCPPLSNFTKTIFPTQKSLLSGQSAFVSVCSYDVCPCLVCLLFWSVPQPAAGVKNKMNTTWRMA